MRTAQTRELEDLETSQALLPERPALTKKQIEFLHIYTASPFMPTREICRQVGITVGHLAKWKKNSDGFRQHLMTEQHRTQQVSNMKRETVMRGMLEAVEMAKDQRQPGTMISGWKEIGRMCGFYEPERREVVWAVGGKELLEQVQNLPKEKLLELAASADSIEGEFEVIGDPENEAPADA